MDLTKSFEFFQPDKNKGRIHIIGCGSVGSTVAEMLVRLGITKITLWDFDTVESRNLSNQMYRHNDIGRLKVDALAGMLKEINPDIKEKIRLNPSGWNGEPLSGYIFLCVDNIELRRNIVEKNMDNMSIKAMFDFRTRLEDAQHYAADWSDFKMKKDFLASMGFSHEEAMEETPVSACNVPLSVCPTVRIVCAYGVANFMNFWNGKSLHKMILTDAYQFSLDAF